MNPRPRPQANLGLASSPEEPFGSILQKPSPSVDFYATYYVRGVPLEGRGSPSSRGTSGWVGFFLLGECSASMSRSCGEPPGTAVGTRQNRA